MFKGVVGFFSYVALIVALSACGHQQDDERLEARQDLAKLGGKADIPSWLRHIPKHWGCGQTLNGKFTGWDSAHLYSFGAKTGYRYTFSFKAAYSFGFGSVVAIYDAETGDRLAIVRSYGKKTELTYLAKKSVKYLVAVYSISWFSIGKYSLKANCEPTGFCVEWEAADSSGMPLNSFYAVNVKTYAEGEDLLAKTPYYFHEDIRPGTCAAQPYKCGEIYQPICADTPKPNTDHDNVCELKAHIRKTAGDTGKSKGQWELGACSTGQLCGGVAGLPCPKGEKCILDGSYPDAGGTCKPVACTFAGDEYAEGETFPAGDGCNTCTCGKSGQVACTKRFCPPPSCDPKAEWYRKYVATDVQQCQTIKYVCPPNTTHFTNACGCGCEQDKSCPEWFNCMPPAGCDVKALKEKCPYSGIAY
ncbi:MAG: hypothetical protein CSB49_08290 [Proteobacteria bacterium]|nr:MAG: hypothetical protein CSB49_08290 [Pseudomonadota bacterium]